MKGKDRISFQCNKCGKEQPRNEEKSNENWNVYDSNKKCECGGAYCMWIDNVPTKPYKEQEVQQNA